MRQWSAPVCLHLHQVPNGSLDLGVRKSTGHGSEVDWICLIAFSRMVPVEKGGRVAEKFPKIIPGLKVVNCSDNFSFLFWLKTRISDLKASYPLV